MATDVSKSIDANNEGKISLAEFLTVLNLGWEDHEASHHARDLGISHPFQFIQEYDSDADGELSFDEFSLAFGEMPSQPSEGAADRCAAMQSHVDTCKTSDILRCSAHIDMAQSICHTDYPNLVQQRIMSSPRGSICNTYKLPR
ncbi:hypothetical protein BJ165DRAFT_1529966 [Panaeolus papilionaceus]|nr:hypothetical protein BJ165DRAFT_1529966 [Panaeolus papilionaceus]